MKKQLSIIALAGTIACSTVNGADLVKIHNKSNSHVNFIYPWIDFFTTNDISFHKIIKPNESVVLEDGKAELFNNFNKWYAKTLMSLVAHLGSLLKKHHRESLLNIIEDVESDNGDGYEENQFSVPKETSAITITTSKGTFFLHKVTNEEKTTKSIVGNLEGKEPTVLFEAKAEGDSWYSKWDSWRKSKLTLTVDEDGMLKITE